MSRQVETHLKHLEELAFRLGLPQQEFSQSIVVRRRARDVVENRWRERDLFG